MIQNAFMTKNEEHALTLSTYHYHDNHHDNHDHNPGCIHNQQGTRPHLTDNLGHGLCLLTKWEVVIIIIIVIKELPILQQSSKITNLTTKHTI